MLYINRNTENQWLFDSTASFSAVTSEVITFELVNETTKESLVFVPTEVIIGETYSLCKFTETADDNAIDVKSGIIKVRNGGYWLVNVRQGLIYDEFLTGTTIWNERVWVDLTSDIQSTTVVSTSETVVLDDENSNITQIYLRLTTIENQIIELSGNTGGGGNVDLSNYLPLSGGTMTGNITADENTSGGYWQLQGVNNSLGDESYMSLDMDIPSKVLYIYSAQGVVGVPDRATQIQLNPTEIRVRGDEYVLPSNSFKGITYNEDYSANYDARSLVDKEYVDNAINNIPATSGYLPLSGGTMDVNSVIFFDNGMGNTNTLSEGGLYTTDGTYVAQMSSGAFTASSINNDFQTNIEINGMSVYDLQNNKSVYYKSDGWLIVTDGIYQTAILTNGNPTQNVNIGLPQESGTLALTSDITAQTSSIISDLNSLSATTVTNINNINLKADSSALTSLQNQVNIVNSGFTYTISIGHGSTNPVDGETRIWSNLYQTIPGLYTGNYGLFYIEIQQSGTLVGVDIRQRGSNFSNEQWDYYIRINDTTDYLIESQSVTSGSRIWKNMNMNIPVTKGDTFVIKSVQPVWAINGVSIISSGTVYFK